MNRIIAFLLCALLITLPALAMAENPLGDFFDSLPVQPDGDAPLRGDVGSDAGITLTVHGEAIRLVFDASPQYSSIRGGLVQASYYAYGADSKTLYELYICFPETARAGMVITPEYASLTHEESSVTLIVSQDSTEQYYFASLLEDSVYPTGSDFTITIESVSEASGAISYSGTLSANLVALDMASGEVSDTLEIPSVPFSFTLTGDLPDLDLPQPTPAPDDMRKV